MKAIINNKINISWEKEEIDFLYDFIKDNCIIKNNEYEKALKMWRAVEWIDKIYTFYTKISETEIEFTRWLRQRLETYCYQHNLTLNIVEDYKQNEQINITSNIKKLRDYQLELEKKLDKINSGFILIPTWGGKTVVMINEIVKKKQKTFLLIHNTKLLYQFIERLKSFSDISENDIWIYGDGRREIKPITVALMQSFWKLSEEKIQEITANYDLFFIDETHHLVANTLLKIGKNVKSKRFYGLTATPYKREWIALLFLERILWPLIYQITEEELQKHKIILKPHIIPIPNYDSYIRDIYKDFFKFENRKIYKYYVDQFKNTPFTNDFIPKDDWQTTLVVSNSKQELIEFYNSLNEAIRSQTKLLIWPIFKRNQWVLEQYKVVLALDIPEDYKRIDMHKIKKNLYYRRTRVNLVYQCIIREFQKNKNQNPNILILSDEIAHLEYMYSNLPEIIKPYTILLHWGIKKKERDEIEIKIKKKEFRVIFATDKFVGEWWDQSHLDVLIVTHMMKDHEGLKQLVGRIIRSSDDKEYCVVYDIVDINCPVTFNQFKKRYLNYYILQWTTNAKIDFINRIITY